MPFTVFSGYQAWMWYTDIYVGKTPTQIKWRKNNKIMKKDTCNVFFMIKFIDINLLSFTFSSSISWWMHMDCINIWFLRCPVCKFLGKEQEWIWQQKKNPPRQKLFSFLDASRIQEEWQRQRTVYYTQETSEYQHSCTAFSHSNSHRAKISRPDDTCLGSRLH